MASRGAGLLVRRDACASRRPSVAPSAWSRDGELKDCDHADGTPATCIVAWRDAPERCAAGVPRHAIVRCGKRARMGIEGTMASPARPE
jgi:hypothetical protein